MRPTKYASLIIEEILLHTQESSRGIYSQSTGRGGGEQSSQMHCIASIVMIFRGEPNSTQVMHKFIFNSTRAHLDKYRPVNIVACATRRSYTVIIIEIHINQTFSFRSQHSSHIMWVVLVFLLPSPQLRSKWRTDFLGNLGVVLDVILGLLSLLHIKLKNIHIALIGLIFSLISNRLMIWFGYTSSESYSSITLRMLAFNMRSLWFISKSSIALKTGEDSCITISNHGVVNLLLTNLYCLWLIWSVR